MDYTRAPSPKNMSAKEKLGYGMLAQISLHKEENERDAREWRRDMLAYRNKFWAPSKDYTDDGPDGSTLQAPYLHSFTDVMVSNIVPPRPAVDIRTRRNAKKEAAKLRTFFVKDMMEKDKVSWKLRRAAALASIMGRSIVKMVWSDKRSRPRARIIPANRFYFDTSAEEWDDIRYAVEVVPLSKPEFQRMCKKSGPGKGGTYPAGLVEELKGEFRALPDWVDDPTGKIEASRKAQDYILVYEYYDFVSKKVYHLVEGRNEPIFQGALPYPHLPNPYHLVTLLDNLTDLGGLSHAQMIREPVSRLNELMTMAFEHTRMLVPTLFLHKDRIDNVEEVVTALDEKRSVNEAIAVETGRQYNMSDVMEWSQTPHVPFDYQRMADVIQELIEFTLALPTYSRGQVGNADVATELALVDTAQKTRNAPLQGVMNETMAWMAHAYLAVASHYLDNDDVSTVYLSVGTGETDVEATVENLDLVSEDGQWDYDFKAFPYNASDDNSTVRLKKFEAFQDLLLNSEMVDQVDLMLEVLEALGMSHVAKDIEELRAAQAAPPAGAPVEGQLPGGIPGMPAEMEGAVGGENLAPGGPDIEPELPLASGGTLPA